MKLFKTIRIILFITGFVPLWVVSQSVNNTVQKSFNEKRKTIVRNDFKKYFDECQVEGSIVIYDNLNEKWILSDTINAKKENLPASTFKVINLLIALETGVIKDENEVIEWPGATDTSKYGFRPDIYHDISVRDAFVISAGWAFIELSKKIGKKRYQFFLSKCQYGNLDLSQTDPDFWNFGSFGISPVNQVQFLKDLYDNKLPFSKRNMDIVKTVMLTEQKEDYNIRSKTGWTRPSDINTGWWIGYLTTKDNVYFFATQLIQDRKNNLKSFGNCRKTITYTVFKDLKILP